MGASPERQDWAIANRQNLPVQFRGRVARASRHVRCEQLGAIHSSRMHLGKIAQGAEGGRYGKPDDASRSKWIGAAQLIQGRQKLRGQLHIGAKAQLLERFPVQQIALLAKIVVGDEPAGVIGKGGLIECKRARLVIHEAGQPHRIGDCVIPIRSAVGGIGGGCLSLRLRRALAPNHLLQPRSNGHPVPQVRQR